VAPPAPPPPTLAGVELIEAFPSRPRAYSTVSLVQAPRDTSRWFLVKKSGVVEVFQNTATVNANTPFVSLTGRSVADTGESGLHGIAFHPDWPTTPKAYVSFVSLEAGTYYSNIGVLRSNDSGQTLDASTYQTVFRFAQPGTATNHKGGHLLFGPDGFLYAGYGDCAFNRGIPAQSLDSYCGKLIRIDVDSASPYAIPPTNPYASGGGLPEIYALGFRNPWRWSFDRASGELWMGDVGEVTYEEIDRVTLGGNYGWPIFEANSCIRRMGTCNETGLTGPVDFYPRTEGESITGGAVYRGQELPSLYGAYVFGDYDLGNIWALTFDPANGAPVRTLLGNVPNLTHVAEDASGELYLANIAGRIYRLRAKAGSTPEPVFPRKLSATGCAEVTDPTRASAGQIPYALNAPFWSDGSEKQRWLALPDGKTLQVNADGSWTWPNGSVLRKDFKLGGKLVETRLLMRHPDGKWAGYSYEWDVDGRDATLLSTGKRKRIGTQDWVYPSRVECMRCHLEPAGFVLGPQTSQLNGEHVYPSTGLRANQLATLSHVGMFDAPLPAASTLPVMPRLEEGVPLEQRARAYLATNCGFCHRPNGPSAGTMDLRYETTGARMNACNASPTRGDLGVVGAKLFVPGAPEKSLMPLRMARRDTNAMPTVGSTVVDTAGVALVEEWIRGMTACPQ
jgi:uncharacterized repeat protein (TIGR03806 family)